MEKYQIMMEYCDEVRIPESSPLLIKFSGEGDSQKLIKTITLTELLRQAWLDPVKTLEEVLLYFGMVVNYDVIKTVAISKKYEGYIKRSEDQFAKVKKLEKMKINWQELGNSSNISYECKQRIMKIKPETFGQLKLIEGIRPATLAVVASRAE
jgi:tRNA uridine 5-carboxymethylaminomethyl modification enzyme